MRHISIIIFILQSVSVFGQIELLPLPEDTLTNGIEEHFYENGQLRTSYTYKNGELDGSMSKWYETGVKKIEGQFKNDFPIGTFRAWHPNGQLMCEILTVDGELKEELGDYWTTSGKQCKMKRAKRQANKSGF